MRRNWFVADFCQPIYETWLAEAVALGRIKAPGFFTDPKIKAAYCGARWDGPAQTHLDPVKEANAAAVQVAHGWKTKALEFTSRIRIHPAKKERLNAITGCCEDLFRKAKAFTTTKRMRL